ncbi:hypothetical protein RKD37_002770 [Streptomyces ambofaciens]
MSWPSVIADHAARADVDDRRQEHPRRADSDMGDVAAPPAAQRRWREIAHHQIRCGRSRPVRDRGPLLATQMTADDIVRPHQPGHALAVDLAAPSPKAVSYMVSWQLSWAWGVDGGDGLFRTDCGRSRGRCCRRPGYVRKGVGSRASMTRRSSPRSSMCWSAVALGGRCRRASGRRSRRFIAGSSSGREPGSGGGCIRRFSSFWTSGTWSTSPARSLTLPMCGLKRGRTCGSEPRGLRFPRDAGRGDSRSDGTHERSPDDACPEKVSAGVA